MDLFQIAGGAAAGKANENESVTKNSSVGKWRNDSVVIGIVWQCFELLCAQTRTIVG